MIYLIALNICLLCVVAYQLTRKGEKPLDEVQVMYSDKIEDTGHFQYKTDGAACFDIKSPRNFRLYPGERIKLATGLSVWSNNPEYAGLIFPRSGFGTKGLTLAHSVAVIDSDYQGEIMLPLVNTGEEVIEVHAGERIMQMGFFRIGRPVFSVVDEYEEETGRGAGGFGSTGK